MKKPSDLGLTSEEWRLYFPLKESKNLRKNLKANELEILDIQRGRFQTIPFSIDLYGLKTICSTIERRFRDDLLIISTEKITPKAPRMDISFIEKIIGGRESTATLIYDGFFNAKKCRSWVQLPIEFIGKEEEHNLLNIIGETSIIGFEFAFNGGELALSRALQSVDSDILRFRFMGDLIVSLNRSLKRTVENYVSDVSRFFIRERQ